MTEKRKIKKVIAIFERMWRGRVVGRDEIYSAFDVSRCPQCEGTGFNPTCHQINRNDCKTEKCDLCGGDRFVSDGLLKSYMRSMTESCRRGEVRR